MMLYKVLYLTVIYLIQSVHKKSVKQQYLKDVSFKEEILLLTKKRVILTLFFLATDYLIQLNKEQQQLSNQLEAKKKEIFCLRAVQKFVCYVIFN